MTEGVRPSRSRSRRAIVSFCALGLVLLLYLLQVDVRLRSPNLLNVILITIDTVRADHLASYGLTRSTSPNLDALARKGTLFENCISQAPWTLPSMASLHTGLYPSEHGAYHHTTRISDHQSTLAEAFGKANYATAGIVSHGFVASSYGFRQGFDTFNEDHIRGHGGVSSAEVTNTAIAHLQKHQNRPFFLWVHYFDPHYDYTSYPEVPHFSSYAGPLPGTLTIPLLNDHIGIRAPLTSRSSCRYVLSGDWVCKHR